MQVILYSRLPVIIWSCECLGEIIREVAPNRINLLCGIRGYVCHKGFCSEPVIVKMGSATTSLTMLADVKQHRSDTVTPGPLHDVYHCLLKSFDFLMNEFAGKFNCISLHSMIYFKLVFLVRTSMCCFIIITMKLAAFVNSQQCPNKDKSVAVTTLSQHSDMVCNFKNIRVQ